MSVMLNLSGLNHGAAFMSFKPQNKLLKMTFESKYLFWDENYEQTIQGLNMYFMRKFYIKF